MFLCTYSYGPGDDLVVILTLFTLAAYTGKYNNYIELITHYHAAVLLVLS